MPPKIESILFCPYTPNSILRKRLQEAEDTLNGSRATCRVKVVERAGPTVGSLLNNKTPWTENHCQRENCAPCQTKPGKCKTPGITYRIICENCKENGIRATYVGETSRTFFDRALDHQNAVGNKDSNYGVVKH